MKKHTGFTLVELLITIAIVGVLLTVGLPSIKTFMQGNQLVASTNEILAAIHVARSEAIKLNSRVTICESSDGETCATTTSWRNGWIVFVDSDGNLEGTGAACAALGTDCLLRIHEGFDDKQLSVSGVNTNGDDISSFTFTSRGLPKSDDGSSQSGTFSICSFDETNAVIDSRAVVLSLSGRVRVSDNSAIISCPAGP